MKVAHVSTYDCSGGAARAAYRLHEGLQRIGHTSRMFVLYKASNDSSVIQYEMKKDIWSRVKRTVRKEAIRKALDSYLESAPNDLRFFADDRTPYGKDPWSQLPESDVIQLHWVSGFVDYEGFLSCLPAGKPLVWTMHGMEALTGGCFYDNDCGRFEGQCGACPQLGSASETDLTRQVWQRKRKSLGRVATKQLHIVSPSRWMSDQVKRSSLLSPFPWSVIPYGLDTEVFSPRDPRVARGKFGIPFDAKVIMFIADGIHFPRKGLHLLVEALKVGDPDKQLFLVCVGPGFPPDLRGFPHRQIEAVQDDHLLSHIYSAADALVVPSLAENLPNTAVEAIACGTPVAGFAVGGIPDIVRPGLTGALAKPADANDLRRAIMELLNNQNRKTTSESCRRVALQEYTLENQASRYLDVYEQLLRSDHADSGKAQLESAGRN